MSITRIHKNRLVIGRAQADCLCCATRQALMTHPELDVTRRVCPGTGHTYLDRGDGLFESDGGRLDMGARPVGLAPGDPPPAGPADPGSDLLSDRPRKTSPKVRIDLERSTFAGGCDE